MLSSYLHAGLPSGIVPFDFPTKTLHAFLFSLMRATIPANHTILGLTILISSGEDHKL
jgi:hypothetical protein